MSSKDRQRKGPITRESILGTIEAELEMVEQWRNINSFDYAAAHQNRAKALIELLEVSDCGNAGGHDKGQEDHHRRTLHDRLRWLRSK